MEKRMKFASAFIFTVFAVFLLNGCVSGRPPSNAKDFAPLSPDATPEQLIAWPLIPVVMQTDGQKIDLEEQFGYATPAVRAFLKANLDDFTRFRHESRRSSDAARPDLRRHLPDILAAATIQTLTPSHKKNLDRLFLMHNLCCQMNDVFFLLAAPHETTDALQKAIKAATDLQQFMASSPKFTIPAVTARLADDGDPLGTEWIRLFDGMTPLSAIPDEWTIASPQGVALPCKYGRSFPTGNDGLKAQKDDTLTLSIQTTLPHDGKTTVFLIAQGIPPGFEITLDEKPLTIEIRKSSARITIPAEQITGKPQSLAISWKCNLHEAKCIFRQPWFVMKN